MTDGRLGRQTILVSVENATFDMTGRAPEAIALGTVAIA